MSKSTTKNHPKSNKRMFRAVVSANRQIKEGFYRLRLDFEGAGAEVFAESGPGQFAELDLAGVVLPSTETIPQELLDKSRRQILLRRPFSFADIAAEKGKTAVDILYRVLGPATLRMTTLSRGNFVSVIGPLGKGFPLPEKKKTALLVAGGMGAGPLIYLAKVLTENYPDMKVIAFAGAKTANELPFERRLDEISQQLGFSLSEFAKYGVESAVATDDGSAGYHGLVTDCLSQWLRGCSVDAKDVIIYSCGPEAMLTQVAEIAEKQKIDCQVSLERMMACGIGLCQSCAVECRVNDTNETVYKLCCKDGPVFDSREVVF